MLYNMRRLLRHLHLLLQLRSAMLLRLCGRVGGQIALESDVQRSLASRPVFCTVLLLGWL